MNAPRIIFAAPASGSGKTTVTCGILQALKNRGIPVYSFKCGPDYIDPMFQEKVIGVRSGTLDLFFSPADLLKRLFCRHAKNAELSVIEGVMGYYDGLATDSDEASTYAVAKALEAPVVLIINGRGQALSALATLEGFLRFRPDSRIRGVIFNQMSEAVFNALKPKIEEMGVAAIGYVPKVPDLVIKSRHLGLVTPGEIADLSDKLQKLAQLFENTLDLDALIALSREVPEIEYEEAPLPAKLPRTNIAIAYDEAFCFLYKDNLALLEEYGASISYFSPIRDTALPEKTDGLILPGGYPELYAEALSQNSAMRRAVDQAVTGGLPTIAECGGFLYLHKTLDGFPMAGVIPAEARRTDRLQRFGYLQLTAQKDSMLCAKGDILRAHEFHYCSSSDNGGDFWAEKPSGTGRYFCGHLTDTLYAGFPHLYFPACPALARRFAEKAVAP